jgi:putative membrane protein
MKRSFTETLLAAGLVLTATAVYAEDPAEAAATVSSRDTEFVHMICDDSLVVQRIGELANQQSQNPRVKQVGEKLALDYGKTRHQFSATAQSLGVAITPEPSAHGLRAIEKLRSYSGEGFDKAALHELVRTEQAVLRNIQDETARGENPALKQLAASSLPALQDDIYQVVTLQSDLNTTATAAAGTSSRGLASQP